MTASDEPGAVRPALLSAGGSAFYDLVIGQLKAARLSRPHQVIVRSGCYLTQDRAAYAGLQADLQRRAGSAGPDLEPALEVGRRAPRIAPAVTRSSQMPRTPAGHGRRSH